MEKMWSLQWMVLENWISTQKNEIGLLYQINSRWIQNFNVRPKKILLEENSGNINNTGVGNGFLDTIAKAQITTEKIKKRNYIKTKIFFTVNNKVKRQHIL